MIRGRILLTVVGTVLLAAASAGAPDAQGARQYIHLDVSTQDGTVSGHADLEVVRAGGGFQISGTVADSADSQGCVTLKAVFPVKFLCSASAPPSVTALDGSGSDRSSMMIISD